MMNQFVNDVCFSILTSYHNGHQIVDFIDFWGNFCPELKIGKIVCLIVELQLVVLACREFLNRC